MSSEIHQPFWIEDQSNPPAVLGVVFQESLHLVNSS